MSATGMVQGLGSYILFTVAGTTYALPSGEVRHMEMLEGVTRVPNAPTFVDGVVFSRGQVVPVVNLRARFVNIPPESIQPPHEALAGMSGRYVEGVASLGDKRLVLTLDLSRILNFAESLPLDMNS